MCLVWARLRLSVAVCPGGLDLLRISRESFGHPIEPQSSFLDLTVLADKLGTGPSSPPKFREPSPGEPEKEKKLPKTFSQPGSLTFFFVLFLI